MVFRHNCNLSWEACSAAKPQRSKFYPIEGEDYAIVCSDVEHLFDIVRHNDPPTQSKRIELQQPRPTQVIVFMQSHGQVDQTAQSFVPTGGDPSTSSASQMQPQLYEQEIRSTSPGLELPGTAPPTPIAAGHLSEQSTYAATYEQTRPYEGTLCVSESDVKPSSSSLDSARPYQNPTQRQCVFSRPPEGFEWHSQGTTEDLAEQRAPIFSRPVTVEQRPPTPVPTRVPSPAPAAHSDGSRDAQQEQEQEQEQEEEEDRIWAEEWDDQDDSDDSDDEYDDFPRYFDFSAVIDDDEDDFTSSDESNYDSDEYLADDDDSRASASLYRSPGLYSILTALSSAESLSLTAEPSPTELSVATQSGSEMEPEIEVAANAANVPRYLQRMLWEGRVTLRPIMRQRSG